MTYSIIARCPRTGQFGIASASYSIAIGMSCDGAVRANTGVALTLGSPHPRNNYLAISLLAQGRTAGQTLTELVANDPDNEYRQIAIIDRESIAVAHTGASVRKWAGHRRAAARRTGSRPQSRRHRRQQRSFAGALRGDGGLGQPHLQRSRSAR
ncbi:MAG: DUF1028 domain-containing protein [Proteobacteria bacterium]|nr:DUF1028 domain-containing protein [Pseudomonadota bacterium]